MSISLTRTICNLFPRLQTSSIYCFNVASGHDPGQEANLEKTYLRKNKATNGKTKKILLAHGLTLQTKHTEQNNPLQGRNKTCLDLRNPTMGNSK